MKTIMIEYEVGDDVSLLQAIFENTEKSHVRILSGSFDLPEFIEEIMDMEAEVEWRH